MKSISFHAPYLRASNPSRGLLQSGFCFDFNNNIIDCGDNKQAEENERFGRQHLQKPVAEYEKIVHQEDNGGAGINDELG